MRAAVWIVLVLGCHKDPPAPSTGSGGSAGPVPIVKVTADAALDAPAVPQPAIELLHAVPATVRVSSRVANKTILPEHLVDRDSQTAWSSATNDLVGAWILVTVPGATITELRLTAGHVGKGPKGEDYFTMNPRIKMLSVLTADGREIASAALDPARRDLQTIAFPAQPGGVQIVVAEIVPGTKKAWREIAISELEAWGTPPPGFVAPAATLMPQVAVGDPNAGTEESVEALCNPLMEQARKDFDVYLKDTAEQTMGDGREGPKCNGASVGIKKPVPPFTDAGMYCYEHEHSEVSAHGSTDCWVAVATNGRWWKGGELPTPPEATDERRGLHRDLEIFETYVVAIPDPQLVVRFRVEDTPLTEKFTVCRTTPKRGCSEPMSTEGYDWRLKPVQNGTDLELVKESGDPPADELGTITKLLKF